MKDSQCSGSGLIVANHPEWVGVLESPSLSLFSLLPTFNAKWHLPAGFPPPSQGDALSLRVGCSFFLGEGVEGVSENSLFSLACCLNPLVSISSSALKNNNVFILFKYLSLIEKHTPPPHTIFIILQPSVQSIFLILPLISVWHGMGCVCCASCNRAGLVESVLMLTSDYSSVWSMPVWIWHECQAE